MIKAAILEPFARKLERLTPLAPEVRDAVVSLQLIEKTLEAGALLLREGAPASHCVVIGSGFACRHKIVAAGGRQILSIQMPGDGVGMVAALGQENDFNLQMLTAGSVALISITAVRALIEAHPQVMAAFWLETTAEAAIQREWTVNVGRRDARSRVAHLLCELAERQAIASQSERETFELPLTQEQLGDATGLTAVHINRTLQRLRAENIIQRDGRRVIVPNWRRLAAIADFQPRYLQTSGGAVA